MNSVSTPTVILTIDTHKFHEVYALADYGAIVNEPHLFLAAYFKVFPTLSPDPSFQVSHFMNKTVAQGSELLKKVAETIEKLRPFFAKGFEEEKDFNICYIQDFNDNGYFKEPADKLDCSKNQIDRISCNCFKEYIEPALSRFATNCGATYNEGVKHLQVKSLKGPLQIKKVKVMELTWNIGSHTPYKIFPKKLIDSTTLTNKMMEFYEDYKDERNCNYQIIAQNHVAIKIHCYMITRNAKEAFKNLLLLKRIDFDNKSIDLRDFSESTILAFLDFVYLDSAIFQRKMMVEEYTVAEILDILPFATQYQLPTLLDCCTNLLSRIASKADAMEIYAAAETYNNEHLKLLHNKLIAL